MAENLGKSKENQGHGRRLNSYKAGRFVFLVDLKDLEASIYQFWQWFVENSEFLKAIDEDDPEPQVQALGAQMREIDEDLVFEIGRPDQPDADDETEEESEEESESDEIELVVSADGLSRLVPVVEEIVRVAPTLPGWIFTAFRQRVNFEPKIRMEGYDVGVEDVYFRAYGDGDHIALDLLVRGLGKDEMMKSVAFILLDSILGEYDVMTKISSIEFQELDETKLDGAYSLKDLPDMVDAYFDQEEEDEEED